MQKSPESLFVDGGVINKNPSPIGGMWAWCLVRRGIIVNQNSGLVLPKEFGMKTISNNLTELMAALKGLGAVTRWNCKWDGTIYTDSLNTLRRITNGLKFTGIPNALRLEALDLRRGRKWQARLLAGHPTITELDSGVARRNGLPVSKWNVWCDQECKRVGELFLATKGLKA